MGEILWKLIRSGGWGEWLFFDFAAQVQCSRAQLYLWGWVGQSVFIAENLELASNPRNPHPQLCDQSRPQELLTVPRHLSIAYAPGTGNWQESLLSECKSQWKERCPSGWCVQREAVPGMVPSTSSSLCQEAGIGAPGSTWLSEWALLCVCWDTTDDSIFTQ